MPLLFKKKPPRCRGDEEGGGGEGGLVNMGAGISP